MTAIELVDAPSEPLSRAKAWLLASRPKTLWAAFVPVLIGTAMAHEDGLVHWLSAVAALFGALAIQVGTNLVNDYSDFSKGADTADRKGPVRVTQSGLLAPRTVLIGAIAVFGLAAASGLYLIARGGWPILMVGVLSIASGFLYTAGPKPLGYLGLGDFFAFVFFGPVAVGGTYYVQALDLSWIVVVAGLAPGFLSVALLSVNNLRDIEEDAAVGKQTLAVRFGETFARWEFVVCVTLAAAIPVLLFVWTGRHPWTLVCVVILAAAIPAVRILFSDTSGRGLIPLLGLTARLSILYALLFSITWVI